MAAVISLRGLRVTIPTKPEPSVLLDSLDLDVEDGESLAIVGRSGSGKTTLLSVLGLMQPPSATSMHVGGIDVLALSESRAARLRNRLLGFVFQNYSLVPNLTVAENVALPLRYAGGMSGHDVRSRVGETLEHVGLAGFGRMRPARLSGGEQQRVAIARALITRPRVILADEPTGALDLETGVRVIDLLRESTRSAECCLVVVTHDTEISATLDRRVTLVRGRLEPFAPGRHRS